MFLTFLYKTNIDFIGKRKVFFGISGAFIALAIGALVIRGANYGIDFTGGILLQVAFDKPVSMEQVRSALVSGNVEKAELQSSGNSVIIRSKGSGVNPDQYAASIGAIFTKAFPEVTATVERTEYVGPAVGKHLGKQALYALIFSFLGMIVYVAFRFHSSIWGVAAVLGIMHDTFITFGIFALLGKEVNLTTIAALLTIAGYSINDTIVVFDRIRENIRFLAKEDLGTIMNRSINSTLSRTVITSLTVFLVSLALFFFGGEVIHDFAFAMLFGVVIGTYSSIYVASALVYAWETGKKNRARRFSAAPARAGRSA